jgi:hypothetical protein
LDLAFLANNYRSKIDFYYVDIYDANTDLMKGYLRKYIDLLFSNSTEFKIFIDDQNDFEYSSPNFQLKIFKSKSTMRLLQQVNMDNNIIDYSDCENLLRAQYDIPTIVVQILQFTNNNFNSSIRMNPIYSNSSASLSFYNPTTMEKLNTSICTIDNNSSIKYRFSLQPSTRMNTTLYRLLDNYDGYEPFDLNNKYYKSRCYTVLDPLYNADTTVNYRRKTYTQNLQGVCTSNCTYVGIDLDNYVNCICDNIGDDILYYFKEIVPEQLPTVNLDIVTCPFITFTRVYFYLT